MIDNFEKEPDVVSAIKKGQTIDAIKKLRASRGIGLKEAKDLVDAYADAHHLSHQRSERSSLNLGWVLLVALALVGYYVFKNHI